MSRILCVDPGDKRLGLAVSDPEQKVAFPLTILEHTSRDKNAKAIIDIARQKDADLIIVGYSTDSQGEATYQGRKSRRLAGAIRAQCNIDVLLWDESYSTRIAQETVEQLDPGQNSKLEHYDAVAAAIILQSYLETLKPKGADEE